MIGKKERARKQQEATEKAARQFVWTKKPNPSVITITDMQIEAYKEGAKTWQDKGNRLVEVMAGVRILICESDSPLVQQARELLLNAIKEFDQCTTS